MLDPQASARYATALFNLAAGEKQLETVDADFTEVRRLLGEHPEISHLVMNSTINKKEKEDFIDKVFSENKSKLLIHFLKVLIRKSRFIQIGEIQTRFHELVEKKQGIQEVKVITKSPLSSPGKEKLKAVLKKKLNAQIRLAQETDPKMLGGLVIRFDGKEVNQSYRDRLLEISQILQS